MKLILSAITSKYVEKQIRIIKNVREVLINPDPEQPSSNTRRITVYFHTTEACEAALMSLKWNRIEDDPTALWIESYPFSKGGEWFAPTWYGIDRYSHWQLIEE